MPITRNGDHDGGPGRASERWRAHTVNPFASLADGLATTFRGDQQAAAMPSHAAHAELRRGDVKTFRRRLGLTQAVMRDREIIPKERVETLARTIHSIQTLSFLDDPQRFALVEVGLRISNSDAPRQTWVPQLEAVYRKLAVKVLDADTTKTFGLSREATLEHCATIRRILHYPPFTAPGQAAAEAMARQRELTPGVVSSVKISRIRIRGFRAVPGEADLELAVDRRPASLVVFGDNGVGKSTIVSAIELACQGTIGRASPTLAKQQLINLAAPDRSLAEVAVVLNDGRELKRVVERDGDQWRVTGASTPFDFSLSPFTLQRADIVRFINTPSAERGQLFIGQFGADGTDDAVRAIRQRVQTAKEARRNFVADLVALTPNYGSPTILERLNIAYLNGSSPEEWRRIRGNLPPEFQAQRSRLRRIENELQAAKSDEALIPKNQLQSHPVQVKRLGNLLGDIDRSLTESVIKVTGYGHIKHVTVSVGTPTPLALGLTVQLTNGVTVAPEHLFSEGVQDLIAILFFIEVAKAAVKHGQAKVLILDDVIQSVDSGVRRKLLDHIASDLKGWQLIITCHDRIWLDHVQETLKRNKFEQTDLYIRAWDFAGGPRLMAVQNPSSDLRMALRNGSPRAVAGSAGLLLETICNELSWTLPASVPRVRGDRYTLGVLFDSVATKLSKNHELNTVFTSLRSMSSLRNQLGAHYNEIANSIADGEADAFGDLVLDLWERVYCSGCAEYVSKLESKSYSCECGQTAFTT